MRAALAIAAAVSPAATAALAVQPAASASTVIGSKTSSIAVVNASPWPPGFVAGPSEPGWVPVTWTAPRPGNVHLPREWSSTSAPAVIMPATATELLDSFWGLRSEALNRNDPALLAEIEGGSALFADTPTCGCGPITPWGAMTAQSIFLPEQTAYPARFFAEVRTTIAGLAVVATLVFVRGTRSGTWKVVIDCQQQVKANLNPESELDHPVSDGGGFDASVPQASSPSPSSLTAALASYWQHWKNSGRAPTATVFRPGIWTTQWGAQLATYGQGRVNKGNGMVGHYRYEPGPGGVWTVPADGFEITCGTMLVQKTWSDPGGGAYQDRARTNWGSAVPPGMYNAMVATEITEPCFDTYGTRDVYVNGADEWDNQIAAYGSQFSIS
jgi:hypothetical protein